MVAAVWQTSADFLKHYVHFRGYPSFDFGHLTPRSVIDANQSAQNLISISSQRVSAYCFVTRRRSDNARQAAGLLKLAVETI
jgi:hypothetical protein